MKSFIFIPALFLLSCNSKEKDPVILAQSQYFEAIAEHDVKLYSPKIGDWLYEHKEKGQTFEQYKKANPIRPTPAKSVIYLLPVGEFTALQENVLHLTRDYVEIFFQQKTVLLKAISDSVPALAFRKREDNHIQLLASYVLDSLLKDKTPEDGIVLMAISAKDLYPKSDWNYVFGLASYANRVGVTSIYRLQNQQLDTTLKRLINVSSHEIGHMMSIHHCTFAKCTMNGSNSMEETDVAPNRLCSECQKKLFWNLKYDNKQRLKQLTDFCRENNLNSDFDLLKSDWDAVQ
jgi:archaemetzincin